MKVGISVYCTVCGYEKKPHGRSAPNQLVMCDEDCRGYYLDPKPGCLWPGETSEDFGYPHCDNATEEAHPNHPAIPDSSTEREE